MKRTIGTQRLTIPVTRSVAESTTDARGFERKGWRSVPDGTLTGEVEIQVDLESLLQMLGARALKAKGKRAVGLGGRVIAIVNKSSLKREGAGQ